MSPERDRLANDALVDESRSISLCEALDRVLHKGVALRGDIVLSVADVDLVYLGLQLILSSTETARRAGIVLPTPVRPRLEPGGGGR
jgi:hypothetical protein